MNLAPWLGSFLRFGLDDNGSTPALPQDLLAAIVARFRATPALVEAFPGGIFRDESQGGPFEPVLIFTVIGSRTVRNMGRSYYEVVDLRFTAYAGDGDLAEELGDLVLDHYDDQPLRFARGYLMSFLATGGGSPPVPGQAAGNIELWCRMLTFRAKVGRNRP